MRYTVEHNENVVIFTLKNEQVDTNVASELKAELLILCQPDIGALLIDLSAVERMDSSGLGALLLAHRQLKDDEVPIVLIGVQELVKKLMSISHIEHLFYFFDTIEEAYENMSE